MRPWENTEAKVTTARSYCVRGTQEPSEGGSPPARESGQASWGGISSLMFWRKRRALRIEGAELPAGSRACDGAPSPQQAGTNGLPERRGGEVEASPTPGRAARAGAPETQPACSWEGKRGHRHVRVCGCAYMCQRMGKKKIKADLSVSENAS